jgi:hypothetical protein
MVPLEYALVSLMSGLDPVWAGVVTGLLYLLQLPLVVFLLSRRLGGFDDFRGAFVLLMAPLVMMWSAWYIPQAYSLTLFLTVFLAGSAPTQIPLLVAGVFGHGGVTTWMVLEDLAHLVIVVLTCMNKYKFCSSFLKLLNNGSHFDYLRSSTNNYNNTHSLNAFL